jgi:hypothetical protein
VLGSIVIAGPVISYYIIIKNMNALAGAYNEKADPQPPPSPTVSPASGF